MANWFKEKIVIIIAAIFSLLVVFSVFSIYRLPIQDVEIYGDLNNIDIKSLKQKIAHLKTQKWLTLDEQRIVNDLSILPWVKNVQIDTSQFAHLKIKLTEQNPFFSWNNKFLVTEEGEYLKVGTRTWLKYQNLPRLRSSTENLIFIKPIIESIDSLNQIIDLNQVVIKDWGEINFISNTLTIKTDYKKTVYQSERFLNWYENIPKKYLNNAKIIDLRYYDGFSSS